MLYCNIMLQYRRTEIFLELICYMHDQKLVYCIGTI